MALKDYFTKSSEINELKSELSSLKETLEQDLQTKQIDEYTAQNKSFENLSPNNFNSQYAGAQEGITLAELQKLYITESWFYIAVSSIAQTIAALPIKVEKRVTERKVTEQEDGGSTTVVTETWVDATGEPEQELFTFPNDIMTAIDFYEILIVDLLSTGNMFIFVDKTKDVDVTPITELERMTGGRESEVQGLYRINPALIEPIPSSEGKYIDGYQINSSAGLFNFSRDEVIHIKMPNPADPFVGMSPIVPVLKQVLIDRYTSEHMIRFFKQGARLGGVIKSSKNLSKDQLTRLQRSFDNDYTGRHNFHRTLILPNGMEYQTIEQNPGQTSLQEFVREARQTILSAFNVPPVKVGLLEGATFANAFIQFKVYFTDTIIPIITKIEQALNLHASILPESRQLRARFDLSGVEALQDNELEKADLAIKMLDGGKSLNEVREKIWELPTVEGGELIPVLEKNKPQPIANPLGLSFDPDKAKLLLDTMTRYKSGEIDDVGLQTVLTMLGYNQEQLKNIINTIDEKRQTPTQGQAQDNIALSDIVPTDITFEQRVAMLTSIAVEQGMPVSDAAEGAVTQALLEGFKPIIETGTIEEEIPPQTDDEKVSTEDVAQTDVAEEVIDEIKVTRREDETMQECVARAVPKLVGEGMDQDQAIAAAFSMCELPEKSDHSDDDEEDKKSDDDNVVNTASGGEHTHNYDPSDTATREDGKHVHRFRLPGEISATNFIDTMDDGSHTHIIRTGNNEDGEHSHEILFNGQKLITSIGGGHDHEFLPESTSRSGSHGHSLTLPDGTVLSAMTSADIEHQVTESKDVKEIIPGFTSDAITDHWKALNNDSVDEMVEARLKEVVAFFKRMESAILKRFSKKLKKFGIFFPERIKADEDVLTSEDLDKFIEEELLTSSKAMQNAQRFGYDSAVIGVDLTLPNEAAASILSATAGKNIKHVTETQRKVIRELITTSFEEGVAVTEIRARIEEHFLTLTGDPETSRAATIARTETLQAVSVGQQLKTDQFIEEFPEEGERLQKIWITARDSRVRDSHSAQDGQIRDEGKAFANGLRYPRDPVGDASEIINCRCALITFLPEDTEDIEENLDEPSSLSDTI